MGRPRVAPVARLLCLLLPALAEGAPARAPLAEREVVPGKLRVRVFDVTLPGPGRGRPCWLYATEGLRPLGQTELVLTLSRRAEEAASDFPEDPISFFASVYAQASRGQIVAEGGRISLDGAPFLGRHDVRGMLCTRPDPLRSALLQAPALALVPVTASELDSAERFGHLRILSLLGAQQRMFPWPGFFDRNRANVAPPPDEWDTILRKAAVVRLPGVRAAVEVPPSVTPLAGQGNLLVSFPISARGAVEEAIVGRGASGPVALLTELDPEADALAVYRSGQKGPAATRAGDTPVSRLAGTFVLFVYATESDSAKLYEDGFTVSLKEASRRALAEAVAAGKDLRLLGGPGSLSIRVRWRD